MIHPVRVQTEMAAADLRQPASRVGWSLALLLTVSVCALSYPGIHRSIAGTCSGGGCGTFVGVQAATDLLLALVWTATAAFVVLAGPPTRIIAWTGLTFLAQALAITAGPALTSGRWATGGRALEAGALCLALLVLATLPDGRFVPRWSVWLLAAFTGWQALGVLAPAVNGSTRDVVGGLVYFAVLAVGVGGQLHRYRRVSDAVARRQTTWLVYGLALSLLVSLAASVPYFAPGTFPGLVAPGSPYDRFQSVVSVLAVGLIPVCIAIAVVREQLFDIDVVIGRTLVYLGLSLTVALVYLAVVGGAEAALGGAGGTVLPLLGAAVVAVLFQPVRVLLQRQVRRWVFGMQDEPYAALTALGDRLAAALPGEDVESRVVASVREALRVPYAAIALREDDGYRVTQSSGTPTGNRLTLPLVHQGEEVGLLLVDDEPGGRLTGVARALLADLAQQAGAAVHGVRLTANLRAAAEQLDAARARLVAAGEEERSRIRRNLHDELAPTLAAAGLTASTAADLLGRDPAAGAAVLERLQGGLRAALDDIRRLVDELRPVMLDQRGLSGAIRERADALRPQLDISVEAPETLPDLPAAVEVAAYRICQEALMNVLRHARARRCRVRLAVEGATLLLDVEDDGVGTPTAGTPGGVGLGSMRERAADLGGTCTVHGLPGGGTSVSVRLPLRSGEA